MKYIIEKELCDPQNGNIVGPYYHVYSVDDDNNKTLLQTFDGDIKEAARFAERQLDFNALEVSYNENPNVFKSCILNEPKEDYVIESSSYDEETGVVNVNVRVNKGINKIVQTLHITAHE